MNSNSNTDLRFFKSWPKVAIIVLNWNGWQDTIECLESLQQITYPNYQIIVVDNDSKDDSVEKIKAWALGKIPVESKFFTYVADSKPIQLIEYNREIAEGGGSSGQEIKLEQFPPNRRMIIIRTRANLGFAGGNNVGINYALGKDAEYVLLVNNDTVVGKTALNDLLHTIRENPDIGIVGPTILRWHDATIQSCGVMHHWGYGPKELNNQTDKLLPFECDGVSGAAMLITAKVFSEIGLFDERYFLYHEDIPL